MVASYPTSVSGTVITATWANTVRDGLVNVFASSSARTSAIVSPEEGMVTFLKGGDTLEYYDGSGWIDYGRSFPRVATQAASVPLTSNTTQQATDLVLSVAASTSYYFRAVIFYAAHENGDINIGMTLPAGSAFRVSPHGLPSSLTTPGAQGVMYVGTTTSSPFGAWSGDSTGATLTGFVEGQFNTSGTAGNIAITFAQGTGNANATTFVSRSYLMVQRV